MPIELEIDGKKVTFQDDQIINMHKAQASLAQKNQAASAVLKACERHGVAPEEFLSRTEGAFGVLADLIDAGVIDNEGKPIQASIKTPPKTPGEKPPEDDDFPPDRSEEIIAKALGPMIERALQPIVEEIGTLRKDSGKLIQRAVSSDLKRQVPGLQDDDIPKILAAAKADPSKKLLEHAQDRLKSNTDKEAEIEARIMKKYNIDPEKNDPNRLKEIAEGGAGVLVQGKNISFNPKDDKAVTPQEAAAAYLNAVSEM